MTGGSVMLRPKLAKVHRVARRYMRLRARVKLEVERAQWKLRDDAGKEARINKQHEMWRCGEGGE